MSYTFEPASARIRLELTNGRIIYMGAARLDSFTGERWNLLCGLGLEPRVATRLLERLDGLLAGDDTISHTGSTEEPTS